MSNQGSTIAVDGNKKVSFGEGTSEQSKKKSNWKGKQNGKNQKNHPTTKEASTELYRKEVVPAYNMLSFWEKEEWKLNMKQYNDVQARIRSNLLASYAIVWGQLTLSLRNKIKADPDYVIRLVAKLYNKASNIDHLPTTHVKLAYSILTLSGDKMNLSDRYDNFTERRRNAEHVGMFLDSIQLKRKLTNDKAEEIGGVNPTGTVKYAIFNGKVKRICADHFYSITVYNAYALLLNYEGSKQFIQSQLKKKQLNQESKPNENANSKAKHPGHNVAGKVTYHQSAKRLSIVSVDEFDIAQQELEQDEMELTYGFFHLGYTSIQDEFEPTYFEDIWGNNWYCLNMNYVKGCLNLFWILLDNQSTIHYFFNTMFLVNDKKTNKRLELHTNRKCHCGHSWRTPRSGNHKVDLTAEGFETRASTLRLLTDYNGSFNQTEVWHLQHVTGHPSGKTLINMATKHTIKDVTFTPRDVQMATKIFGPSIYGMKGKAHLSKERHCGHARTEVVLSFKDPFQVIFREHTQMYEGNDNSMTEWTIGAIAAGPPGNLQGGVKFFSLEVFQP
eukprot:jgi/Psemu1/17289/gm1.17289_g